MYIHIYICICIHIYVYIYMYTYICIHIYRGVIISSIQPFQSGGSIQPIDRYYRSRREKCCRKQAFLLELSVESLAGLLPQNRSVAVAQAISRV